MNNGLTLQQFHAGYGNKRIITDINVEQLSRGKVIALLGPNGCGKTTLLRALAGLGESQGELWLDDINLMKLPFAKRTTKVVYLPQTLPAGVHLHVLESIIVAQRASGSSSIGQQYATRGKDFLTEQKTVKAQQAVNEQQQVITLLEQLGISALALSYLDELSGGQKQLVGLAQSLIRHPAVLLLDEPLSALDLNHQFHVMEVIKRETKARQMVTIIVVHDINAALRHADHILMLKKGKLIVDGKPEQVITPHLLAQVYGVQGRVECCSRGIPQVVIDGTVAIDS